MNSGCPDGSRWNFGRAKVSLVSQFKTNIYRINQALTFAHMSKLSKKWKKDRWVMTYDADQFYSEELKELEFSVKKTFNATGFSLFQNGDIYVGQYRGIDAKIRPDCHFRM